VTGPRRIDDIDLRHRDDGDAELVDGTGRVLGVVNAMGAAVFELCDGATTVEEMAVAASDVFDVDPSRAAVELDQAIDQLCALGVVDRHGT
jgi:hypothetical protein